MLQNIINDRLVRMTAFFLVAGALLAPAVHASAPTNVQVTAVSSESVSLSWALPPGTTPFMVLSDTSTFSTTISSAVGLLAQTTTSYYTLSSNTTYWFKVKISTDPDADYSTPISTFTLARIPVSAVSTFSAVMTSSFTVHWDANGNGDGTVYGAVVSTSASFPNIFPYTKYVSTTPLAASPEAGFDGLWSNTTYYFFVRAVNHAGVPTAYTLLGSTKTLPSLWESVWNSFEIEITTSIAWADFDNDGDLDIAAGNDGTNRVYRNNGDETFSSIWNSNEMERTLSIAWADFDNDGDLDLAAGNSGTQTNRVYRNNSDGSFTSIWNSQETERTESIAWGDFDNDGDLDIAVGNTEVALGQTNRVYRNNSDGSFTSIWNSNETERTGSIAWADFDNDGDLDLAVGNGPGGEQTNRVYRNDGGNTFTSIWNSQEIEQTTSIAWADFDNDGDLDIAVGNTSSQPDRVYRNNGDETFSPIWNSNETGSTCSIAWGDFDNDGDLDLAAGNYGGTNRVYRGFLTGSNTAPTAPGGLSSKYDTWPSTFTLTFKWGAGDYDSNGSTTSIYYAIAVATVPMQLSGNELRVVYPSSATVSSFTLTWTDGSPLLGHYLRPAYKVWPGDGLPKHGVSIGGIPDIAGSPIQTDTTYYYRIQAVDAGLARSTWSAESFIYVPTVIVPWSSVWNSNEVETTYSVAWADFDNDGDLDIAAGNYGETNRVYRNNGDGTFSFIWNSNETEETFSIVWADFDNDGDLDIAVGNYVNQTNRIYRNNGDDTFSPIWNSPEIENTMSITCADFDNDGDLDIAAGNSGGTNRIYRNDGDVTFSSVWNSNETESTRSIAWADFDNDGDLDITVGNNTQTNRIYRNEGGETFSSIWNSNETEETWSIACADFDNDGDLDIAAGNDAQTNRIYRNNGDETFSSIWNSSEAENTYGIAWADFDNDGDLDIAAGNVTNQTNRTYRNNGDETFSFIWNSNETEETVSIAWGDFDNDGDLDLAVGNNGTNRVYRGFLAGSNTAPTAPGGLSAKYDAWPSTSTLTFKWDAGDYDSNGSTTSIYYAIAAATVPMQLSGDKFRVVYPSSATVSTFTLAWTDGSPLLGHYLRPAYQIWPGDGSPKHGVPIGGSLQGDTSYYFRVQAIDAGLARSTWSAESFIYVPVTPVIVSVAAQDIAPEAMGTGMSFPLLKLTLSVVGGTAGFNQLTAGNIGTAELTTDIDYIGLYEDTDLGGYFDISDVFISTLSNTDLISQGSPFTFSFSPQFIADGSSRTYFVAAAVNPSAMGESVGVRISSAGAFGLATGVMENQAIYPIQSSEVEIKLMVPAYVIPQPTSGPPPDGGIYADIYVDAGQTVLMTSSGTWTYNNWSSAAGPNGDAGCGPACVLPSAPMGSLMGRIGTGDWFFIGTSSTVLSNTGGDLYLAMNDETGNYSDNFGFVSFGFQPQSVDKIWTGNAGNNAANHPANWLNNSPPANGDNVIFSGTAGSSSTKNCDWNLIWRNINRLTLGPDYSGKVTITGDSDNELMVDSGVVIMGGTLDISYRALDADYVIVGGTSANAGVLDLGEGSYLYLGPDGITLQSSGTLKSHGTVGSDVTRSEPGYYYPVDIQGGTVSINNSGGTYFEYIGGIYLSTAPVNFNYVEMNHVESGESALTLQIPYSSTLTFNNWEFGANVSTNVNTVSGNSAHIIMANASGPKMGTPNENGMDPGNYVTWSPDGGGSPATLNVTVNYSGSVTGGLYIVFFATAPEVMASSATVSSGTAYGFTNLIAPNTYFVMAYMDELSDGYPNDYDPRAKTMAYVPGGASVPLGMTLYDVGQATGTFTKMGSQSGRIHVEAWDGPIGASNLVEDINDEEYATNYSISLPSGTYNLLGYIDVNGNWMLDSSFESSGTALGVVVSTGEMVLADFTFSAGSAAVGGTVYVSTMGIAGYGAIARMGEDSPFLRLGLWTNGGDSDFKSLKILLDEGGASVLSSSISVGLYRDNGNMQFDDYDDFWVGGGNFIASSTATITLSNAEVINAATKYYFVTVKGKAVSPPDTGKTVKISISSTASIGLLSGQTAGQSIYPIVSPLKTVKATVEAVMSVCYDDWCGFDTGLTVGPGQMLTISATGQWTLQGIDMTPMGGIYYDGIVGDAPTGALIARIEGSPWVYVGSGTTISHSGEMGNLYLGMNKCSNCTYNDTWGRLYVDYSIEGTTWAVVMGTVTYTGDAFPDDIVLNAQQWDVGTWTIVATHTVTLAGGTTIYPYVFSGIPAGDEIMILGWISSDVNQRGEYPQYLDLLYGDTYYNVDFPIYPGVGTAAGTIDYPSGLQIYGDYVIAFLKSFETGPLAYVSTSSVGDFSASNIPAPGEYYVIAFRDVNGDYDPNGPEPIGCAGTWESMAQAETSCTQVFISSTGINNVGSITLNDMGQINGNINLGSLYGEVVVAVGHGVPGDFFVVENREHFFVNSCDYVGCTNDLYYTIGMLAPATDYAVLAFMDKDGDGQFDPGENFGMSALNHFVSANNITYVNFAILESMAPPAPENFQGVAVSTLAIKWQWDDVMGESSYTLTDMYAGFITSVTANTTFYIETVGIPNSSGTINGIKANSEYGNSQISSATPVYTRAAKPGLTISAIAVSSITLGLNHEGNPDGTSFQIIRSTDSSGGYGLIFDAVAPMPAYADSGLNPDSTYYYGIRALNSNNIASLWSSTVSACTLIATGYYISGTVNYAGAQSGNIIVQAFLNASFTGSSVTVTLAGSSTQQYYIGGLTISVNYYVRAFVDVTGDGLKDSVEDSSTTVSFPINVSGGMSGKDITIIPDTIAPGSPTGLTASAGFNSVSLSWAAPSGVPDLLGYEITRSTSNTFSGVQIDTVSASAPEGYVTSTVFTDDSPVTTGDYSYYRVRAVDWGLNVSPWTFPKSVLATSGGKIEGIVYGLDTSAGVYHVRVSTSPDSSVPSVVDIMVSTDPVSYTVEGLQDGIYYVRGYRDFNGDFKQDLKTEPSGTHGGIARPFDLHINNAGTLTDINMAVCDRIPITMGVSTGAVLSSDGCRATDRGVNYYSTIFAFEAGYGAGKVPPGSEITITVNAVGFSDTYLYLIGPSGDVYAEDDDSAGNLDARIIYTLNEEGIYYIEPTSYAEGQTGAIDVYADITGGFSGQISGTINYFGEQSGDVVIQIFESLDDYAWPVMVSSFTPSGGTSSTFTITGLPDGSNFYLKAFRDFNANSMRDTSEAYGFYGSSVPVSFSVSGGMTSASLIITLTDPAMGTVSGNVSYFGGMTGDIRIEATVPKDCPGCEAEYDRTLMGFTTMINPGSVSGAYVIDMLAPSTSYIIKAYVDENDDKNSNFGEPYASSGTISVVASTTSAGVNLALINPGAGPVGCPACTANISGTIFYVYASTSQMWVGWASDTEFNNIIYQTIVTTGGLTTSWDYSKASLRGDTSYYMAAFLDYNGNGLPEDEGGGEPITVYGGFENIQQLYLPESSNVVVNLTLTEPATGQVAGVVYYYGTQTGLAKVEVEADTCESGECYGRISFQVSVGVSSYPFTISFLDPATDYHVYANIDVNGNQSQDFGEPGAWIQDAFEVDLIAPTTGVFLTMMDPGQFGGGSDIGEIHGTVLYGGGQGGDRIIRMFENSSRAGAPSATMIASCAGIDCDYYFDYLGFGTFYLDAFVDVNGNGVYDPAFEAYGTVGPDTGIMLDQDMPQAWGENGTLDDPGTGGPVGSETVFGSIRVTGTNPGTVRLNLYRYDEDIAVIGMPVQALIFAYGASVDYNFSGLSTGTYMVQGYVDEDDDFWPDENEVWGQSATSDQGSSTGSVSFCIGERILINSGDFITGALADTDCVSSEKRDGTERTTFVDYYTFYGSAGDVVDIEMTGISFTDSFIYLYRPSVVSTATVYSYNMAAYVDGPMISGYRLPEDGVYTIGATTYGDNITGDYSLKLMTSGGTTGSISGTVQYDGTQGGEINIGLFNSYDFMSGAPPMRGEIVSPVGTFNFSSLPSGVTYYIAGFVDVNYNSNPDPGEDIGVYGGFIDPTPIILRAGQNMTGLLFEISPSTFAAAGGLATITGEISYSGGSLGSLRVQAWNDSRFEGFPVASRMLAVGSWPVFFDMQVPADSAYFFTAFLDLNDNGEPDYDEPKGSYQPYNEGPESVYVSSGAYLSGADAVNFMIFDQGQTTGGGEGWAQIYSNSASTISAGEIFTATITVRIGDSGLNEGGKIGVGLPFNFYTGLQNTYPTSNGYVMISSCGACDLASILLDANWMPHAELTVDTGKTLNAGASVYIVLNNISAPCQAGSSQFHVGTAMNAGSMMMPLVTGDPSLTVEPGSARTISFRTAASEDTYNITMQLGTTTEMLIEARDNCWNPAAVVSSAAAIISVQTYDYMTGQYAPDTSMRFSQDGSAAPLISTTVVLEANRSSATFYALPSAAGFKNIAVEYDLGYHTTVYMGVQVLADPITGANVSMGVYNTARTSDTITPNGDGNRDRAYINFTLGDPNMGWHVLISSRAFRSGVTPVPIWETWGWGNPYPGQIVWEGRYSPWINMGGIVPTGAYFIRIEIGSLRNDTLRIDVEVPQVTGQVTDAGTTPPRPLSGVYINAWGPFGWGQAITGSDGNYAMLGLAEGTYDFEFKKDEYAMAGTTGVVVSASGKDMGEISMTRAPALIVIASLTGSATKQYDQWGWINIHTEDWERSYNGGLRLRAGTTTFDDGGKWDSSTNEFITRTRLRFNVEPGTYTIEAELSDFGRVSTQVYVGAEGKVVDLPPFVRKANISGLVRLPDGTVNQQGMWVSVNAVPVNPSTMTAGSWGGIWLEPGKSSGTYNIFGVDSDTYMIRGQVEGFSKASAGPVFVGVMDITGLDLLDFGTGGAITGEVTVKGDTSGFQKPGWGSDWLLPLRVYVNVWSPQTYSNGWAQVYVATNTELSSNTFTITGLDPGATYQMFANLDYEHQGSLEFSPSENFPIQIYIGSSSGTVDFSFDMAEGIISGTILLPTQPAVDFSSVSMTGRVLQSANPYAVGEVFTVDNIAAAAPDGLPGFLQDGSRATFLVEDMETQTIEITFTYSKTGMSRSQRVEVVNGFTTMVEVDLRDVTYSISGQIDNRINNSSFNTYLKLVESSSFTHPSGYPQYSAGTVIPIEAIRRDFADFGSAVAETFDADKTRVGYITKAGSYTITNLQEGVYIVHTLPLKACATCEIAVAPQEKVVTIMADNHAAGNVLVDGVVTSTYAVNFTLIDGWNVSGVISIDNSVSDARTLLLTLRNKRNEVVRSTSIALGNAQTGSLVNSVDYSFSKLPGGSFYTLEVKDLMDSDGRVKYAAAPIKFPETATSPNGLQSDLANQNVTLKRGAVLTLKLRDAQTLSLITRTNASLLASNFKCFAVANPWVQGGYYVAASSISDRPIESDGTVRIGPVMPDVSYDVKCEQENWDVGYMRTGSQNYAPVVVSGVKPSAGETRDIGVLDLYQGQAFGGVVTRKDTGAPLANIRVTAKPSYADNPMTVQTMTNPDGSYTLWMSTYISRYFDITAAPRESNQSVMTSSQVYGEVTLRAVDLDNAAGADFELELFAGRVFGKVVTPDGGAFSYPFGEMQGFPVAGLFLQPYGTIPEENPLGDISAVTEPDGTFNVVGLHMSSYTLRVVSLGYAVYYTSFVITASGMNLEEIHLYTGATVTGQIRKPDSTVAGGYTSPGSDEIGSVVAANDGFTELVFGMVESDPVSRTITGYEISGFKPDIAYFIALVPPKGSDIVFPSEGQNISFSQNESTATKTINLTFRPLMGDCMVVSKKAGNNIQLKFTCSKSLRNKISFDDDLSLILSTSALDSTDSLVTTSTTPADGTGYFLGSGNSRSLSADRKQLTAVYRLADDEKRFSVKLEAYINDIDPATGDNFLISKIFDFYAGIETEITARATNMGGGSLQLEAVSTETERTSAEFEPGTFLVGNSTYAVVQTSVTVGMRRASSYQGTQVSALYTGGRSALARYGDQGAVPPELYQAMRALAEGRVSKYRPRAITNENINPFSAFYDIFLPAGISHVLSKNARLTLTYDVALASAAGLDNLNVYYYNPITQRYDLEDDGRDVDPVNGTISVNVDHLSVFIVLGQVPPVPGSTATYSGTTLEAYNFPNPFNLKYKTMKTSINPELGDLGGVDCTTNGTCIRVFIPAGTSGEMKLKIYNIAGELVRDDTLTGYTAGQTKVWTWDGRNQSGREVASGVYIGMIRVGGKKKFFKMAVIKDSKYQ